MKRIMVATIVAALGVGFAQPITFTGTGDDFFDLTLSEPMLAQISHDGSGHFAVQAYESDGSMSLLVNVVGEYGGVRPLGFDGPLPVEMTVRADGAWVIELVPLTDAPQASAITIGTGDAVLAFGHLDARRVSASHLGDGHFFLFAYGDRRALLVNHVGAYEGRLRVPEDVRFLVLGANGPWELAFDQ